MRPSKLTMSPSWSCRPAAINLAVHGHVAVDDGLFHASTRVEEPSELQELPEANGVTADRDVVDRSRVGHPGMLAEQCRP
jgi:hypothetical protein